ncbi:MAG: hypothetical protein IJ697_06015 [Synergistaceae bacterium]|nr:hypothetical protein [Synergistaceae bacterium]
MKRVNFAVTSILLFVSLFFLSGCGGGSSGSSVDRRKQISTEVIQAITLNSPAIERNKRYTIHKGVRLSGMSGARFYAANTGSEAVQSTLNLGFNELISPDEAFVVVNDTPEDTSHRGLVVFAYDPSGITDDPLLGGSVSFSGGQKLRYRTLSLEDTELIEYAESEPEFDGAKKPYDAEVYAEFTTDRGTTTFSMGRGNYPSFIENDPEYYLSRDIPSKGNVLRIVRKVNTFSGIIAE